jgi:hypothetical protein
VKTPYTCVMKVFLLCCALVMLSSCATQQETSGKNTDKMGQKIACLAVLPTEVPVDADRKLSSSERGSLAQGAQFIDSVLVDELKTVPGVRFLNENQMEGLLPDVSGNRFDTIKRIGKKLNCEAVLVTVVNRYHQREGGEFAVDNPASASFSLQIIRTDDGQVIWHGNFDETQESLLSNLFSFGKAQNRGFKWVSVEDLVRQGVHDRLDSCPYIK